MTRAEIIERIDVMYRDPTALKAVTDHPAFESFCTAMADCQYGPDPCAAAWEWFKRGWEDA